MAAADSQEIERRLRSYAEEALRDVAKLPYERWRRVKGDIFWDETIGGDEVQFNAEMTKSDEETFRLAVTATMKNAEFDLQPMKGARGWMFHGDRFMGDYRELPAPSVTVSEATVQSGERKAATPAGEPNVNRADPSATSARIRGFAEDSLLELVTCLPHSRLCRLQGKMTWEEMIGGDEMLFHLMMLEFNDEYLHCFAEACLVNSPPEMIDWKQGPVGSYGEFYSVSIDDVIPRSGASA